MSADVEKKYNALEKIERQRESYWRRKGVESAVVSFQLEGIEPTAEFLSLAERFVQLEIDGDEFEALAGNLYRI